jgi:hypothetical protein
MCQDRFSLHQTINVSLPARELLALDEFELWSPTIVWTKNLAINEQQRDKYLVPEVESKQVNKHSWGVRSEKYSAQMFCVDDSSKRKKKVDYPARAEIRNGWSGAFPSCLLKRELWLYSATSLGNKLAQCSLGGAAPRVLYPRFLFRSQIN